MPADPEDSTTTVRADRITKRFDDIAVVTELDLAIDSGTILGLIGPSGSGKTTAVRMLTGLIEPTEGSAFVAGRPALELTSAERSRIGYLPQIPALFPQLSLWENLSFHASMYGLPIRRRSHLRALLDWVELGDDRRKPVSEASGGMQRRLALAAAVVHEPLYLFLDEPTAGIDPILREKFWREFRSMADDGRTVLVTTQYVGEAAYCDLVGLLSDGHLLMLDTPDNLRRAAYDGEAIDVVFTRPPTDREILRLSELPIDLRSVNRQQYDGLRLVVGDASKVLVDLRSHLESIGLEVIDATEYVVDYDEAFVRLVERHRESTTEDLGSEHVG